MNYTLQRFLGWIMENKLVTFLSICLFSFVIATIALATEKNNLQDDLQACRDKLEPTTTTTTTTTIAPEPTTETTTKQAEKPGTGEGAGTGTALAAPAPAGAAPAVAAPASAVAAPAPAGAASEVPKSGSGPEKFRSLLDKLNSMRFVQ